VKIELLRNERPVHVAFNARPAATVEHAAKPCARAHRYDLSVVFATSTMSLLVVIILERRRR
jgi:hypothetical protein